MCVELIAAKNYVALCWARAHYTGIFCNANKLYSYTCKSWNLNENTVIYCLRFNWKWEYRSICLFHLYTCLNGRQKLHEEKNYEDSSATAAQHCNNEHLNRWKFRTIKIDDGDDEPQITIDHARSLIQTIVSESRLYAHVDFGIHKKHALNIYDYGFWLFFKFISVQEVIIKKKITHLISHITWKPLK